MLNCRRRARRRRAPEAVRRTPGGLPPAMHEPGLTERHKVIMTIERTGQQVALRQHELEAPSLLSGSSPDAPVSVAVGPSRRFTQSVNRTADQESDRGSRIRRWRRPSWRARPSDRTDDPCQGRPSHERKESLPRSGCIDVGEAPELRDHHEVEDPDHR